jgi:hypothetical protein
MTTGAPQIRAATHHRLPSPPRPSTMPKNVAGTRGPNGRKADVLLVAARRRDKSKPAHGLFEGERTMRRAARERAAGQGGTPGRTRSASSIEHPAATGGERTFGSRAAMESCACRMRPRRVASASWLKAQRAMQACA